MTIEEDYSKKGQEEFYEELETIINEIKMSKIPEKEKDKLYQKIDNIKECYEENIIAYSTLQKDKTEFKKIQEEVGKELSKELSRNLEHLLVVCQN